MKFYFIINKTKWLKWWFRRNSSLQTVQSFIWCSLIFRTSVKSPFCKNIFFTLPQGLVSKCFFEVPISTALSDLIFAPLIVTQSFGTSFDQIWAEQWFYILIVFSFMKGWNFFSDSQLHFVIYLNWICTLFKCTIHHWKTLTLSRCAVTITSV